MIPISLASAGCLGAGAVECSDGSICPSGTVCDIEHEGCASQEQFDVCEGQNSGASCVASNLDGVCDEGVCIIDQCGDGVPGFFEACDDGNTVSGDGCRADCLSDETCGNGVVDSDSGEDCDCGTSDGVAAGCLSPNSDVAGATCRSDCVLHCGDGIINEAEECDSDDLNKGCSDFGFDRGALTCSNGCGIDFGRCGQIGWKSELIPNFFQSLDSVWRAETGEVFVVGGPAFEPTQGTIFVRDLAGEWTAATHPARLRGVWGRAADDVYTVGVGGSVLHFDGSAWNDIGPPAVGGTFNDIAGDEAVLYAVGNELFYRYDGAWTFDASMASSFGVDVHAVSVAGDRVFAVATRDLFGPEPLILERQAADWDLTPAPFPLADVIVFDDAVFVVGNAGLVQRRLLGEASFTTQPTPTTENLTAVFGSSSADVFAVGANGTALHYDGRVWSILDTEATSTIFDGVTAPGQPPTTIEAGNLMAEWSGSGLTAQVGTPDIHHAAWLLDSTTIYTAGFIVGNDPTTTRDNVGTIHKYDSLAATPQALIGSGEFRGVWGRAADEIYAVGFTEPADGVFIPAMQRTTGGAWIDMVPAPPASGRLLAMAGNATELFVAGDAGSLLRFDGTAWSNLAPPTTDSITSISEAQGTLFAVAFNALAGEHRVLRYDGAQWDATAPPAAGDASVWAYAADGALLVGTLGSTWHYDGSAWNFEQVGVSTFLSVSGTARTDVFATTANNLKYYFDGEHWSEIDLPTFFSPRVAASVTDVVFVGFLRMTRLVRHQPW